MARNHNKRIPHLRASSIRSSGTRTPQQAPGPGPTAADRAGHAPESADTVAEDRDWHGGEEASVLARGFTAFANGVAHLAGRPVSFVLCCVVILGWAISGPIFHYSDTWQLIINTGTTIITFLMVFLIQNTQNRDGAAVQAKLDELIRAIEGARNHFIGIEHLTEEQLEAIRTVCEKDAQIEGAKAGVIAALEVESGSASPPPKASS